MEHSISSRNKLTFSVSRKDHFYDFAAPFEEIFRFRFNPEPDDLLSVQQGVRLQESLGFDFQAETDPTVEILPIEEIFIKAVPKESPSDFSIFITIEDIALGIRKVIHSKNICHIKEATKIQINLKDHPELGFWGGYIIRCFISRERSISSKKSVIWSKSNIVYLSEFIVNSSDEEALYEIAWTRFSDPNESKNVLFYVNWELDEVSSAPYSECFQVVVNNNLQSQFKKLEKNKPFGAFSIRLIADRIIFELAENTLRYADLSSEPTEGSLHDKMRPLFKQIGLDFEVQAALYQKNDNMQCLEILSDLNKRIQGLHKVAAWLRPINFGSQRQ